MQNGRSVIGISESSVNEGTLYERTTLAGTQVRIRRTTAQGVTPVVAVLEQLSRPSDGAGREDVGDGADDGVRSLSLLEVMVQTELDAIILLEPYARSEAAVTRLAKMRE